MRSFISSDIQYSCLGQRLVFPVLWNSFWSHSYDFWVPCTVLCITAFSLRRSVSGRTLATLTVDYFIVRLYLSISCFLCMFYLCKCCITSHFWSCNHLPNKNAALRGLKGWHREHRFLAAQQRVCKSWHDERCSQPLETCQEIFPFNFNVNLNLVWVCLSSCAVCILWCEVQ